MSARRWPNEPAQVTPLIPLERYYRRIHAQEIRETYDEGVAYGFLCGVGAAAFVWSVLSGLLAAIGIAILSGLVDLVGRIGAL